MMMMIMMKMMMMMMMMTMKKLPVAEEQSVGVTSQRVRITTVSHVNCVSLLL